MEWTRSLHFLADASALLNQSLDLDSTLQNLAWQVVPALADGCVVEVVEPDGSLRRRAFAHADPHKLQLGELLRERFPPDLGASGGLANVLRTGKSEVYFELTPEMIDQTVEDPEERALIHQLSLCSSVDVPLISRGKTLGVLSLMSANSGRKFGPTEVALAEQLAHRAALTVENGTLYRQAQEAIALRDEFLSVASHELKTPLTPLNLKLQALRREAERDRALSTARIIDDMVSAELQVRKLTGLINDLLDVSRITQGKLELAREEVDLTEVVRTVIADWAPYATRVGCSLELTAQPDALGQWDRRKLEQVVTNLLTNALKYGRGRPVRLSVSLENRQAVLRVHDEGIGIDRSNLERIFGRFERAVSGRHYGGLGLGLYLTRQWIQALGGSVEVQSKLGAGSIFVVRLPAHPIDSVNAPVHSARS